MALAPVSSHLLRLFRSAQNVQWDVLPRNQTITDGSGVLGTATYNLTDNSGFQNIPANANMALRVGGGSSGAAGTITLSAVTPITGLTTDTPNGGGEYLIAGWALDQPIETVPFIINSNVVISSLLRWSSTDREIVKTGTGILTTYPANLTPYLPRRVTVNSGVWRQGGGAYGRNAMEGAGRFVVNSPGALEILVPHALGGSETVSMTETVVLNGANLTLRGGAILRCPLTS